MNGKTISLHYNQLQQAKSEEELRLRGAIFDALADRLEVGSSSHLYEWFDGDYIAMAKHLGIQVMPPFDEMSEEGYAQAETYEKQVCCI